MAFNLSPSVNIIEKDFSTFVSGVATSIGAVVGDFAWGPAEKRITVSNEEDLVTTFGEPDDTNYKTWFTAANFLAYGNNLKVVRVVDSGALNASDGTAALIENEDEISYAALTGSWFAKYPGAFGNSIGVSVCQRQQFDSWKYKSYFDQYPQGNDVWVVVTYTDSSGVEDVKETWELNLDSGSKDGFGVNNYIQTALERNSKYVYCQAGTFSAAGRNPVLGVGQADGIATEGSKVFTSALADFTSPAVVAGDQLVIAAGLNAGTYDVESITDLNTLVLVQELPATEIAVTFSFQGTLAVSGEDSAATLTGGLIAATSTTEHNAGWDFFASADESDVSLLMEGGLLSEDASKTIANYMIDNVAEVRKDCVAFISPSFASLATTPVTGMISDRNLIGSTSYAFMDGNYKFQYDKYNDVFRWVPLNGDIAGLAALTDETNDAWWSFAGYNRGGIKNITKLKFNPSKTDRDDMYVEGINPVITEAGEGSLLFGDKTLQTKSSAFDRINVRRLFIVLEKAIANAAKYNLFEFNDEFTRARFVQTVTPFLRDVQGKRGIIDFSVIADETVNTPYVIDANEFRATILIKPNKSINFINLTFTAVSSGVSFDEVTV